jgi:hypothetical protein
MIVRQKKNGDHYLAYGAKLEDERKRELVKEIR